MTEEHRFDVLSVKMKRKSLQEEVRILDQYYKQAISVLASI